MLKKYVFLFFILFSMVCFGQEVHLSLTAAEKKTVAKNLQAAANTESTLQFVRNAKKAGITKQKTDSLLLAKETYRFISKRIKQTTKLRDSLFLFTQSTGNQKRANFNSYRKKLAQIISKEQFYQLYQPIIDGQIEHAVADEIAVLENGTTLSTTHKKQLTQHITPYKKEQCLLNAYHIYDKQLLKVHKITAESEFQTALTQKLNELGLKSDLYTPKNKTSVAENTFLAKAKKAGIAEGKAKEIVEKILILNDKLEKAKALSKTRNPENLYTLDDENYHASYLHEQFEAYLTSQLTLKEYTALFWDQLAPKIELATEERFTEVLKDFNVSIKGKKAEVIKKWVNRYVQEELITKRYYAYESSLANVKVKAIQHEAKQKYQEVIFKTTGLLVSEKNAEPRVKSFLANAEKQGVAPVKAHKIMRACLEYELKQEELMASRKYDKHFIYSIGTSNNDKNKIRDSFRLYLTKHLSKEEYRKLFWEQLAPEIKQRTKLKLQKVQDVYSFQGQDYNEIQSMLEKQVENEIVAEHYYGYDKKIAKQKVKALNYKFDNEYKNKITQLTKAN